MAMAASACGVSFPSRPAASASVRPRGGATSAGVVVRAGAEGACGKWWAPLLGWSGRADYLEAPAPVAAAEEAARRTPAGGRLLTEEKARELRARMVETESFHDAMYHSAIASRLARSA